ncbi:hypothetical protein FB384_004927 [Prauserella sediminis]|uniref:Uncharacterized protein n=1 Tax=Prauserella sediminis TaxID=577680 RepID=A0A839XY27_9PSEU|nr:hypothetical protein [Prauserella sediminis]MBB3665968.1 hypothetical protein [Prauserella sediminis]
MSDDERPVHDVAVTVFARCEGVDYGEAANLAMAAVRSLFRQHGTTQDDGSRRLVLHMRDEDVPVDVHYVTEAGQAVRSGYLWLHPTKQAYPRADESQLPR